MLELFAIYPSSRYSVSMASEKYKVENIILFGDSSERMIESDITRISATPTTEFHILRHFSSVPDDYIQKLVGQKYDYYDHDKMAFAKSILTKEDIKSAFETKGSKFFSGIPGIETPEKLIELIKDKLKTMVKGGEMLWINHGEVRSACFTFFHESEVGYADLIDINTLNESERARIVRVSRGNTSGESGVIVNTVTGVSRVPINKIAVEIIDISDRNDFSITAYPGDSSPDFPNPKQGEEEYGYCKDYWDNHTFVE